MKIQKIFEEKLLFSELLNNCVITCSSKIVFEAKEIVFHENLIKDKAEENDS